MVTQPQGTGTGLLLVSAPKPLLRGWSHAVAAVAAVILTGLLCWRSRADVPRLISLAVFGLSMIELYSVSATYHIGHWNEARRLRLRALDHANIFLLIAGTYTPLCFNVLSGWPRITMLVVIWMLALAGVGIAVFVPQIPRWVSTSLYIGMGWVALFALPAFWTALHWPVIAMLVLGGVLYTIGGVVYGRKGPNPFPRVFGFHEIFHLFVIAGSIAFAATIWIWVLPFPRV